MPTSICDLKKAEQGGKATEIPNSATSNVQHTPKYDWYHRECYRTDPEPQVPVFLTRTGGIHLSWIHYCCLCFALFTMGFIITIWVGIALSQSTSIVSLANDRLASIPRWPLKLDAIQVIQPSYIQGALVETIHTLTVTTTVVAMDTITVDEGITMTLRIPVISSATAPENSGTSSMSLFTGSTTSSVYTSATSVTSSSTSDLPSPVVSTKWVSTTLTTSPSHLPIRPTTRHFGPKDFPL